MAEYILAERTAHDLIRLLQIPSSTTQAILAYFTPFCDCDVREYVINGLTTGDSLILQQVRLMMGSTAVSIPHLVRNQRQVPGLLIATTCVNGDLVGTYGTATVETSTRVLVADDPACQAPPP